jgi:hypothetical protein
MREVSVCFWAIAPLRSVAIGRSAKVFLEKVEDDAGEREAFDALRAPFGADLAAWHAPDFFGVGLEKQPVKLAAKAIDQEVFEGLFVFPGK